MASVLGDCQPSTEYFKGLLSPPSHRRGEFDFGGDGRQEICGLNGRAQRAAAGGILTG